MPEEWGGTTVFVNVSAKKKQNLEQLLEMLLLVADLQELKANPKKPALRHRARGAARQGPRPGGHRPRPGRHPDGRATPSSRAPSPGKVRALVDDHGERLKEAGPSTPVEILGLAALPEPGDQLLVVTDQPEGAVDRRLPPAQAAREGDVAPPRRSGSRTSAAPSPRASSRSCRWWSRPTCRARSRRSPTSS